MLLHVKTQKGRGDPPSERSPESTHGISISKPKIADYSSVFGEKICDLAEKNPKIVAITAAMADGTGLAPFREKYPGRFFDVGIAEGHAITFSAGLSKAGLLPVCAIYSTFLQRAFDSVFHDIALQNLPIIIAIDRAGLCANDGPTHHGLFDIAWLRSVPHLVLMQPKDPWELEGMLEAALRFRAPCCIRYPRRSETIAGAGSGRSAPSEIQLGRSEIIARGTDVCLIALGEKVAVASEIARQLPQLSFTIVNARFVKPLDRGMLLDCARRHRRLYTIEDHVKSGGLGSAVVEYLAEKNLAKHVHTFAWPDAFIPHASRDDDLKKMFHFTVEDMVEKIRADHLGTEGGLPVDGD
jgi:1-deoxy-D-xylulose-5-phosphate synthase